MKKVFAILFSVLLFGCATKKEVYLIIIGQDQVYVEPKREKETIYTNRFEKQFIGADSIFMDRLRKASKEAREAANKQLKSRL